MRMKSLLWTAFAFLFVSVDLSVFGFDILPDIAGYLVLFIAFSVLTAHEDSFSRPRLLVVPLVFLQAAFLMRLVENESVIFILQVVGVLLDLLMAYFAFIALGRLAVAFEQDKLRRTVDSAFIFYALTAALPLLAALAPDLERLGFFVIICLCLYVFNLLIRCYREILLPIPEIPEEEMKDGSFIGEEAEDGILPHAVDGERTAPGRDGPAS